MYAKGPDEYNNDTIYHRRNPAGNFFYGNLALPYFS